MATKTPKKQDPQTLRKHFIESVYETLDGVISPTPCLSIIENGGLDVKFLNGEPSLPKPYATEITVLDLDMASLFFDDFILLYEGVTGVGKTYTSDALFMSVFGENGWVPIRLGGGLIGSSALEPFTTTVMNNGLPRTVVDSGKCEKYGGCFIDEINRGDQQEVFQVLDRKIIVNGQTEYLRIPIPGQPGRFKKLSIIAAMNPADAQHNGALDLDIAGENRFLKFTFPNGVTEAGASQIGKVISADLYSKFWERFRRMTGLMGDWKDLYPIVTDPAQTKSMLDGRSKEFIDVAIGYVGKDPKRTVARNAEVMFEGGLQSKILIKEDNNYQKIIEAQGRLKHGFVRRDITKLSDMSRVIAFIKGAKKKTYEVNVGLNDVAAAIGVVLESKVITSTPHGGLMALVNDARSAYSNLCTGMNLPEGYGIRQAVLYAAIGAGHEGGFESYKQTLRTNIDKLNVDGPSQSECAIKSRILADLIVLEDFSKANQSEISDALKMDFSQAHSAMCQLFSQRKSQSSIYELRLASLFE